MPDQTLFDQVERDPLLRTMDAVIAPVAASANALVDDMEQLEIADAVYEAFGVLDSAGGLSRAQIRAHCAARCPDEHAFDLRLFERRIDNPGAADLRATLAAPAS